ncbi:MAG: SLBB domain-containing protein [Prevotellaceae bacterium]|jgi:protein involved in polysaccharide export with SLBB domain|nr:SLBB domain-containing protein [Prevotellaceae bacterium]
MKKLISCLFFVFILSGFAWGQMSDQQIINYVKQESAKGTSQQEMATYLLRRGVTQAQLERIKSQHESESAQVSSQKSGAQLHRERTEDPVDDDVNSGDFDAISAEILPTDPNPAQVFGRNIFNTRNLSFAPNTNIPTPSDYKLGPGDEVIIDIWGASQANIRQTISPEGSIMVDRLGPIYLNGKTVHEANNYIKNRFANLYAGIGGYSEIMLTLGRIRTIQINVMGDVSVPGTYSLSSLSSVFHALYRVGGVTNIGSLRSVKLYRGGKLLKTIDVYPYILEGKFEDDIRLMDDDVIIVSPYISLVNISGKVKRAMYYEMKENETLDDLINYAGGFEGDAYRDKLRVTRTTGAENLVFTVQNEEFSTFKLQDKDVVTVSSGIDLFENRVEILGAVYRTGYYEIGKDIHTVKELITVADGLRGDAFLNRAVLTREKEDFTTETMSVDMTGIMDGKIPDIVLHKNDILYIPSIHDLKEYGSFVIAGAVARPGAYKYSENTTLEDLIVQAGGLLESASVVRVDIARRIINPKSVAETDILSKSFTLGIKDGFIVEGEKEFLLEPYDHVYIRRSPEYFAQQNVHISGEVLFPGSYALSKKTERLSDLINRAGGITQYAYMAGARLVRERSAEELYRSRVALRMASQADKDSIAVNTLDLDRYYGIGIDLYQALLYPGSDYDLVLREGDRILVPEYENTVKINGAVMYPNTISYKPEQKLSYYINQAGGYMTNAKKRNAYVIYMNGMVSKISKYDKKAIQPGSEIIIPSKQERQRLSTQEILSIGTSVISIASLVGILINALKK